MTPTTFATTHPVPLAPVAVPTAFTLSTVVGDHDALRTQAEVWVAQTFFGQMLRQMRQSPFKSDLFGGGRGGEAFAEMHHGLLAQRMAGTAAGRPLVDAIVRRLGGDVASADRARARRAYASVAHRSQPATPAERSERDTLA